MNYSKNNKGYNLTTEPIRKTKDIRAISRMLKAKGHISSQTVGKMVRSWVEAINLKGQYGAHTLRKTFGYQQRVAFGAGYEILCKRYNHSSTAITMRYLGIEDRDVCDLLMNEVG